MAPGLLCCILLLLFFQSNAEHYLTVRPGNTVVSVGSSIQLNCSINCPLGNVEWKGLDNADNGQYSAPGYSVQTLKNISIPMEGTRICVGSCPGSSKRYQKTVQLDVYALPKTLLLSNTMKNGVRYLNCLVERVYPLPDIICYRGPKILGEPIDTNEIPDVDDLHNVTWSWEIPEEDWIPGTLYRCEAQVSLMNEVLTREGTLYISSKVETTSAVPASSISQITSTPSWKPETPYVTTTTSTSPNPHTIQGSTTTVSHPWTISGEYTRNATISRVTIQSTRPAPSTAPAKPTDIVETTSAVPASSISQITSTPSWKPETPYVTTTTSTSPNPHTIQGSTTTVSSPWTIPGEYTRNATISRVTIQSTRPAPSTAPAKPTDIDVLYLTWTILPAIGVVGSFVLSLQIYRHLNKKGFFEPNHMEFSKVKEDIQSQGSLQAVLSYDRSTKKEFSMC
ncbi:mucosal addressin cell adhesion molecule 1 isoform X1 [Bufo gargarizans]|uniref:mucosal addressin cell adhesion molecule 1 isoform X1 n=1 Tax=Bufo gargarizans TaxID=30331 RepID=UPI001CF53273|nr:mucosal addressin cell adhesion molecule 1 isoform X1 [Bufo gargarizans]